MKLVSQRDQHEITRSRQEAYNTVWSWAQVRRYLNTSADTAFALEYAFHLLGNVEGKHILDLGCGTGEEIPALVSLGAQVIGMDISPDLIALALERLYRQNIQAELKVASAYETGLPDHSVDIIFCTAIMHHLDIPLALTEMHRILHPNGFLIFNEPICFSRLYRKLRACFPTSKDYSNYEHPLTKEEFLYLKENFYTSDVRFFRLPFVAIARYLKMEPKGFVNTSNFILRHYPYLERFATAMVMKARIK
jgi:SAM-dependent methyltransferase